MESFDMPHFPGVAEIYGRRDGIEAGNELGLTALRGGPWRALRFVYSCSIIISTNRAPIYWKEL